MAYNPYAALSIDELRLQSEFDRRRQRGMSERETGKQKKKLAKEFSEDLEAVIKAAEAEQAARAKKNKGLFKGINIIGSLFGPIGSAITGGLTGLVKAEDQRKALKSYLNTPKLQKYGNIFLKGALKDYEKSARDIQRKTGKSLLSGLMQGAVGGLTGMIGGPSKTLGKGLMKDIFKKPMVSTGVKSIGVSTGVKSIGEKTFAEGVKMAVPSATTQVGKLTAKQLAKNLMGVGKEYVSQDLLGLKDEGKFFGNIYEKYKGKLTKEALKPYGSILGVGAKMEGLYPEDTQSKTYIDELLKQSQDYSRARY